MSEYQALLTAIRTNPREDTPRLVFADWLDERGAHERAEFIRVQCELERIGFAPAPSRYSALHAREHELLALHESRGAKGVLLSASERATVARMQRPARFSRGFLSSLTVLNADDLRLALRLARTQPLDELAVCPRVWLRHAKKVLALHPDPLVSFARWPLLGGRPHDRIGIVGGKASLSCMEIVPLHPDCPEMLRMLCALEWPGVRFDWERSERLWRLEREPAAVAQ